MQCLHYKPVSNYFCSRGGGGVPLVEVAVNSKEENFEDFNPNYVQESGLRVVPKLFAFALLLKPSVHSSSFNL
jgi:hypothetical protein